MGRRPEACSLLCPLKLSRPPTARQKCPTNLRDGVRGYFLRVSFSIWIARKNICNCQSFEFPFQTRN
uniref:Uncharacterized protein n=1 Tax=Rhizophora mucronata TaxID=61149 RepID=A0A2P2KIZ2_RHIMU